ncbi:uncharacterized protein LTR77_007623 [Saxophila tyrrhenica]|uniref:Uncharacterized protein n=1 Tax=Saxophila tyrrhenica TaxID=1690608 RepID=A0AAV9P2K3_9PEZI|nr:hypothetical protein LTR77_007623 [Saxophila tyrrhenica]
MRASAIIGLSLAALATSSPIEARQDDSGNVFSVSDFVFGCTTTCDWSFDVTVVGSQLPNHPPVKNAVTCSGSLEDKDFVECSEFGNGNRYVAAYITPANQLRLKYHVTKPRQGAYYEYFGHRKVNAQTSGKPQPTEFTVKEVRAIGVA